MHGGRGVLPRVVWFYLGATDALLLLAGIAFEVWLGKHSFLAAILVGLLYVVVAALANRYLYRSACALQPGGT